MNWWIFCAVLLSSRYVQFILCVLLMVGFFMAYPAVAWTISGGIVLLAIIMRWLFPAKTTTNSTDFIEQLEKISKLHAATFLTDEEWKTRKNDLILSLLEKPPQEGAEDFFTALVPSVQKGYLDEEEVAQIKGLLL